MTTCQCGAPCLRLSSSRFASQHERGLREVVSPRLGKPNASHEDLPDACHGLLSDLRSSPKQPGGAVKLTGTRPGELIGPGSAPEGKAREDPCAPRRPRGTHTIIRVERTGGPVRVVGGHV